MFLSLPSSISLIGLTRIFEVWKDNKWTPISWIDLDNGHYIIRIRYTEEDQKLIDEQYASESK